MPVNLKGLEFETDEGKWRIDYIGDPIEAIDSGRVEYYLRFKWIDPHDAENLETPERRLRLLLFKEDMIADDAEKKLVDAVHRWVNNSDPDIEARFDYASPYLEPRN
jgi:hypothetical protein